MRLARWRARRRGGPLLALCVTLIVTTGCQQIGNVEQIRYGREYSADGERLRLGSLQPRCGCVSLANITDEAVWLESWFYGIPRGAVVLGPGEQRRVLFDWAGPENSDFYELVAFRVAEENGRPARDASEQGGLLIQETIAEYTPMVLLSCSDPTCTFGPLAMNRALEETGAGPAQTAARQRGVTVASVIEAAAPLNRCGCMMLRNTTAESTVTLRATRHGTTTGQLVLPPNTTVPIPFDWGGALESDLYVIDAIAVEGTLPLGAGAPLTPQVDRGLSQIEPGGQPGDPLVGFGAPAFGDPSVTAPTMTIRVRDYISVVGQLLDMDCTPQFAEFRPGVSGGTADAPPPGTGAGAIPDGAALTNVIQCPWRPDGEPLLGMSLAYDPTQTRIQAPAAAPVAPPASDADAPASPPPPPEPPTTP